MIHIQLGIQLAERVKTSDTYCYSGICTPSSNYVPVATLTKMGTHTLGFPVGLLHGTQQIIQAPPGVHIPALPLTLLFFRLLEQTRHMTSEVL